MKRLIVLTGLVLAPVAAQAAWFCGEEPTEFAQNRVSSALSGRRVDPNDITYGRYMGAYAMVCQTDKDGGQICHSEPMSPPTPEDYSARVDDYEARINTLDRWAGTQEDGCLSDAYHSIAGAHRKIIAKDRRAIEFMRTPAPDVTPKGGS